MARPASCSTVVGAVVLNLATQTSSERMVFAPTAILRVVLVVPR